MNIESNVPIPQSRVKTYRSSLPLRSMEVGQSVFVPESVKKTRTVRVYANQVGDSMNRRFTCRKVTEDGQVGIRVWRTA
jgi:hypothetical protein